MRSLFVELKSPVLVFSINGPRLSTGGGGRLNETSHSEFHAPLGLQLQPQMGAWIPLRITFCLAFVSFCLPAQAASTAEEEECNHSIQTSSKADLCKCPTAACETAVRSFG